MNELYEILWVGHEYTICSLDHLKSYLAGLYKDTPNSYPELSAYEFGAGLVMLDGDVVARLYENDEMTPKRTSSPATRSFIHFDQAWYAARNRAVANYEWIDDITLVIDDMPGEVHIEWIIVGGMTVAPRLVSFHDSWTLLATMPDVIALLATLDGQNVQPMTLCTMLEGLGFVDATETVEPTESKEE